jgi:hypothetical protein
MRGVRLAQRNAAVWLHEIGRPHFGYPRLEDSSWFIPQVLRWEPLTSLPSTARRAERRLLGQYVVPSLVEFRVPADKYLRMAEMEVFMLHLRQRTGSPWDLDMEPLPYGYVVAERLSQELTVTSPDGMRSTTMQLPAPQRLKASIWRDITRGLFRDGWRRQEIEAERHRSEDREDHPSVPELWTDVHQLDRLE